MNSRTLWMASLALSATITQLTASFDDFDDVPGYAAAAEARLAHQRGLVLTGNDRLKEGGLDVFGSYLDRTFDGEQRMVRRDAEAWGAGAAYTFARDNFGIRLQVEYLDAEAKFRETDVATNPASGEVHADGALASIQAGYFSGNWSFALSAGIGESSNRGMRINGATTSATGRFNSDDYFIGARIEYRVELSEASVVIPFVAISYNNIESDAFNEANPLPVGGAIDLRQVYKSELELAPLVIGINYTGSFGAWTPQLGIAWVHNLEEADVRMASGSINNPGANEQNGELGNAFDENAVWLQAGIHYAINEAWSIGPEASLISGSDESTYTLGLRLKGQF